MNFIVCQRDSPAIQNDMKLVKNKDPEIKFLWWIKIFSPNSTVSWSNLLEGQFSQPEKADNRDQ